MRHFVIGYGSLIGARERERAGLAPLGTPVTVRGFRRAWNVQAENKKTYLGAVPSPSGRMNAVLFPINREGLARLDGREGAYDRLEVDPDDVSTFAGDQVWAYVPQPRWISEKPDPGFAVKRSYVDEVIAGCLEIGQAFCGEFLATTVGWEQYWYDNRRIPEEERLRIDALVGHHYPPSRQVTAALPPRHQRGR